MKLKTFLLIVCIFVPLFGTFIKDAGATLRFYDGFEAETLNTQNNWTFNRNAASGYYSIDISSAKARKGSHAVRMMLKYKDNLTYRNQLQVCNGDGNPATPCTGNTLYLRENGSNWIGFSSYWPGPADGSENFINDTQSEQFAQIHTPPYKDAQGFSQGPSVSMDTGDWKAPFDLQNIINDDTAEYGNNDKYSFSWERGVWTDWVVQYKPSDGADGIFRVWKNGTKIIDKVGPNSPGSNSYYSYYVNVGIYKPPWKNGPSSVSQRVMYFDEIRVGDTDSSYAEVDPSQSPPQCNDGIDNDNDGKTDYNYTAGVGDPDCTSQYSDNSESGASASAPVIYVDSAATGCSTPSDTDYNPATRTCGVGAYRVYSAVLPGINAAVAGDDVILRGGTYNISSTMTINSTVTGAPGNPITIKNYVGEIPVLDRNGGGTPILEFLSNNNSYIIIDGLTFQDGGASGVHIKNYGSNYIIRNCTFKNLLAVSSGVVKLEWVHDVDIDSNIFQNNGSVADQNLNHSIYGSNSTYNITIRNNYFKNNYGYIITAGHTDAIPYNYFVYNNIFYNTDGLGRTRVPVHFGSGAYNSYAYNNTIYLDCSPDPNNAFYYCGAMDFHYGGAGIQVKNNIIDVFDIAAPANVVYDNDLPTYDYNLYYINGAATKDSDDTGTHSMAGNPLFTNISAQNFSLQATSPAINKGVNLSSLFTTDFAGTTRPQGSGYDIGAYEYTTDTTPPQAITKIEAESGTLSSMEKVSDSQTSGGQYIKCTGSNSGSASYSVNVPESGNYKITGKVYASDSSSDSFYLKINNESYTNLDALIWDLNPSSELSAFNVWREDDAARRGTGTFDKPQFDPFIFYLPQGVNSILIKGREPNTKIDYFYLQKMSTSPTCSSFTYSTWGACQPDNTQARTIASSSPANCTGGNPALTQTCVYKKTYGITDFISLIADWLKAIISPADLNKDGIVNTRDLGIMMTNWQ